MRFLKPNTQKQQLNFRPTLSLIRYWNLERKKKQFENRRQRVQDTKIWSNRYNSNQISIFNISTTILKLCEANFS